MSDRGDARPRPARRGNEGARLLQSAAKVPAPAHRKCRLRHKRARRRVFPTGAHYREGDLDPNAMAKRWTRSNVRVTRATLTF